MSRPTEPPDTPRLGPAALIAAIETRFPMPETEIKRLEARKWILSYAKPGRIGAEIGVFHGHFSSLICDIVNPRKLYLIDPWTKIGQTFGWSKADPNVDTLTTQVARDETQARVALYPQIESVLIEDVYPTCAQQIKEPLDFADLDSGHKYENTRNELKHLDAQMAPDGIILGDNLVSGPDKHPPRRVPGGAGFHPQDRLADHRLGSWRAIGLAPPPDLTRTFGNPPQPRAPPFPLPGLAVRPAAYFARTPDMTEPAITPDLIAKHGIKPDEYARILDIIGRTPTFTELGIFSAMWNEHCSYKSSKKWLRTLPTTGPQVICGPGENAGVVDIGDGQAVIFKMESHNHPSYIEPHQGAATGVGGILRDVFTMGARPIAAMNALSFGLPSHPKTAHLVKGVVEGVGSYGNAFGVPTVGGEVRFHASYNGNCLVNAFAAGLADADKIFYSVASGVGMPVVYLGAKTGRDGVGGATMASAEFDDTIEEKRPTVQVGDPFTEKRLLEACLELMASGAVISIQDMGAAGLTCSAVEMGDKGGLGIKLQLADVPQRETGMSAYEMMLSESQERMLMVLKPELEDVARAIFVKWDLDFAIVGETIPEDRFLILHGNDVMADLPLSKLSSTAPEYDRPWVETPAATPYSDVPAIAPLDGLRALIGSPSYAHKAWVWEQYDTQVGADTVVTPGLPAGVVRVHGTAKALAFTSDVTPRYVKANPYEGGKQAVAEAYRNLTAMGATPLATTDNLNFGNPEKPEIMGQLVGAIKGIGAAVAALDMPIVSGNVSLYNETDGSGILPTPTIGAVGILHSLDQLIHGQPQTGDLAVLIGGPGRHLGQSALLAEALGEALGDAPPVDLTAEKRNGDFIRAQRRHFRACTDLSDGGLALAAFEMAEAAGLGLDLETADIAALFGEDQARYLVAIDPRHLHHLTGAAQAVGVPAQVVGRFGGASVSLGGHSAPLADLSALYRTAFATTLGV